MGGLGAGDLPAAADLPSRAAAPCRLLMTLKRNSTAMSAEEHVRLDAAERAAAKHEADVEDAVEYRLLGERAKAMEEGMAKGMAKGMEASLDIVRRILKRARDESSETIAKELGVSVELVESVSKRLATGES